MPYCPNCGNEIPTEAVFCGSCGTRLQAQGENLQGTQGSNLDEQAAIPEPISLGSEIPAVSAPEQKAAVVNPARSRKKWYAITASALVVLFAGLGIYLAFFAPYALNEKNFPDAAVREALAAQLDSDGDGKITRDQAKEVTSLNLSQSGVAAVDGLKLLPNLRELDLSGCKNLEQIDTSQVQALEMLNVRDSALQEIDLSRLAKLQSLAAKNTNIQEIDVSQCVNLIALSVEDEVQITGLDATNLREEWLLAGYTLEGQPGVSEGMARASGWLPSKVEVEYSYDEQARLIKQVEETTIEDNSSTTTTTQTYSYDDDAKIATMTRRTNNSSYFVEEQSTYNDIGQRISKTSTSHYTDGGLSETLTTYQYDNVGHLTREESTYDEQINATDFIYNDSGQLTNMTRMYGSSESAWTTELSYDEAGRVTQVYAYDKQYDRQESADFSYDEDGKCISSERTYVDNNFFEVGQFTYSYDSSDALISAKRLTAPDDLGRYFEDLGESFFDQNGNVARREITQTYISGDGEVNEWYGNYYYTYGRVFVLKDAPLVQSPSVAYTPISIQREKDVLDSNAILKDQSPVVQGYLVW